MNTLGITKKISEKTKYINKNAADCFISLLFILKPPSDASSLAAIEAINPKIG